MPMAPEGPKQASSAGRFADRWQQRAGATAALPAPVVVPVVTSRPTGAVDRRRLHSRLKYTLSSALDRGRIEEALEAVEELLRQRLTVPNDLLYRLICATADTPGVERFAKAIKLVTLANIRFDVMSWAALVGKLMARDAPHAQVRVCLNFGLAKDADVMKLTPVEAQRESDVAHCFAGAEHLDIGELSDEEDLATILRRKGVDISAKPVPKSLLFAGCTLKKVNGIYRKLKAKAWESALSPRPVYKKSDGPADKTPLYTYYYEPELVAKLKLAAEGAEEWKAGWYVGTEVGGGGITFAYSEDTSELPPTFSSWTVIDDRKGVHEEFLGFESVMEKKGSNAHVVDWEMARLYLEQVDLEALRGRVDGIEQESIKYFTHFFILLHLEALAEVATFRGRFGFRTGQELANFGIALIEVQFESKWGYSDEARRMPLPGWPDTGQEKVAFKLPRHLDREKFSMKRGESVLVSRGHPLESRVSEGSVTDVDLDSRTITLIINGKFPEFDFNTSRFRLDCFANRTTFERQLTALLQFVTMQRTKMQDMLIAAGVGKVDLAVLGGDGFADPDKATKVDKDKQKAQANKNAEANDSCDPVHDSGRPAPVTSESKAEAEVIVPSSEQELELPDDGKDFGEDGTWIEVPVAAGADNDDDDFEEVEASGSEEENAPPSPPPVRQELDEDTVAKSLAQGLASDFDDCATLMPVKEGPRTLEDLLPKLPQLEEVEKKLGPTKELLSEEERVKRATLALANEEAEGIDEGRLTEAKAMVKTLPDLSEAQRNAITNSLSKRLTIVQGPPGTGKTHTSVRILTMWAKQMQYTPLLATSECNIAVDNIAEGLAKAGVKVVRIGRPEKVRDILEPVCLDNMVKANRAEREKFAGDDIGSDLEELWEEPSDEEGEDHKQWQALRQKWRRKRAWDRKQDAFARTKFMEEAEVLCSTTITAGSQALQGFKFHAILIDEVAQATEVSAIVPIICRGAKQIALCGDHCQLPPSTVSREAELRGMSLSLYSRLVEAGVPFQFLDTQYRAHPALMEFSASCIYQGKLKNGIAPSARPVPKGIPWPNPDNPAAFFESPHPEGLNGESKDNTGEAEIVLKLIYDILAHKELTLNDIGIVAPYKGQVRTLRRMIFSKFPEAEKSRELEIASVDNFQGREKELIIFTAVRSNRKASVGFLNDWRRLNVMITRARRGLVVVGNAPTLACDRHWRLWMEFTEKQGGCPAGTVAKAIRDAKAMLVEEGLERKMVKIFPEPTVDEILDAATPAPLDETKKAKGKTSEPVVVEVDAAEHAEWSDDDNGGAKAKTKVKRKIKELPWDDDDNAAKAGPKAKAKLKIKKEEAWDDEDYLAEAVPKAKAKLKPKKEEAWDDEGGNAAGALAGSKAKAKRRVKDEELWEDEDGSAKAGPKATAKVKAKKVKVEEEEEAWDEEDFVAPAGPLRAKVKQRVKEEEADPATKPKGKPKFKEAGVWADGDDGTEPKPEVKVKQKLKVDPEVKAKPKRKFKEAGVWADEDSGAEQEEAWGDEEEWADEGGGSKPKLKATAKQKPKSGQEIKAQPKVPEERLAKKPKAKIEAAAWEDAAWEGKEAGAEDEPAPKEEEPWWETGTSLAELDLPLAKEQELPDAPGQELVDAWKLLSARAPLLKGRA